MKVVEHQVKARMSTVLSSYDTQYPSLTVVLKGGHPDKLQNLDICQVKLSLSSEKCFLNGWNDQICLNFPEEY